MFRGDVGIDTARPISSGLSVRWVSPLIALAGGVLVLLSFAPQALAGETTVEGTVTGPVGESVPELCVSVNGVEVFTDADGDYAVVFGSWSGESVSVKFGENSGSPCGQQGAPPAYPGLGYVVEWYDDATSAESATPVPLAAGQHVRVDGRLELKPFGEIDGYKRHDVSGLPIAAARVGRVYPWSCCGQGGVPTDTSGYYLLPVRPGEASVRFQTGENRPFDMNPTYLYEYYDDQTFRHSATIFNVPENGRISGVNAGIALSWVEERMDRLTLVNSGGQWEQMRRLNPRWVVTDTFYYGNPGDIPFVGDWDCDGEATPGLYRQSDGYVYLRNSNTQGVADVSFFFGNPGDVPISGDFDGDGCDTVSIYRPAEGRFFIINELGDSDSGLGPADFDFFFGNPGDQPFVGDLDGDGFDEVGLHRATTGRIYFRNTLTAGVAETDFVFGDPGDVVVTGDWNLDGTDTVGVYRPSTGDFYLKWTNTSGNANFSMNVGPDFTGAVVRRDGTADALVMPSATGPYVFAQEKLWLAESPG